MRFYLLLVTLLPFAVDASPAAFPDTKITCQDTTSAENLSLEVVHDVKSDLYRVSGFYDRGWGKFTITGIATIMFVEETTPPSKEFLALLPQWQSNISDSFRIKEDQTLVSVDFGVFIDKSECKTSMP